MGVKTIALTESKGALAGALVVREHEDLVFISHSGMVQRTSVRGINRYGRGSQGVRVMNLKEDDTSARSPSSPSRPRRSKTPQPARPPESGAGPESGGPAPEAE